MREFLEKLAESVKNAVRNRRKLVWNRMIISFFAVAILCTFRVYVQTTDTAVYLGMLLPSFVLALLTALYGLYNGIACFMLVFLFSLITCPQDAFMDFFYLSEVLYFTFAMRAGWFESKRKLCRNLLLAVLILGNTAILTYDMVALESFSEFRFIYIIRDMSLAAPQIVGIVLLIYFVNKKIPAKNRRFFPGLYDSRLNRNLARQLDNIRRKNLSSRISFLIISQTVILGVAAALYANMLIPTLGNDILSQSAMTTGREMPPEGTAGFSPEASSEQSSEEASEVFTIVSTEQMPGSDAENKADKETAKEEYHRPGREERADALFRFFNVDMQEYIDSYGEFKFDGTDRQNLMSFVLNDMGKSFDLKMIMLLINTAFPMVVLSIAFAQMMIADPVSQMSENLAEYTADFEHREAAAQKLKEMKICTRDEIELLYDSVLKMDEKLNEYLEQVKKDQELEEELRIAQATSNAKSAFLSNMSHEIRTPINAVLGMDEMILRETEEPNIAQYATDIQNSGRTLLSLVNDILDFSKIEAGKMDIIPVEYELSSVINDLINMISVKAKEKNLALHVDVNRKIPHLLYGDEIRIKQCVTNILSNAVKYTMEGSVTLRVDYEYQDSANIFLKFQVVDTGIGIKEEDLKKLYSPFERIEEKRNRTIEGTGLGMNIVKQLLALMDSELVVKSVYGEGSDFSFAVRQRIVRDEPIGDFNETYKKSIERTQKYQESFHAPTARILVVDDTKMNLTVIRGLLKPLRLQVDTAESGKETLQLVQQKTYDVIFLDHRMPEMDGIETRAAMRALSGNLNKNVPVIALTANVISGAREIYLNAGFDDYLSKPIDSAKLEKLLMEYIPKEKLILPGDERFETENDNSVKRQEGSAKENTPESPAGEEADLGLQKLEGIDYESGIKNCMNEEILLGAMHDFYVSLETIPDLIEKLEKERNFKEYTVQVHALKSSARLIGATDLSRKAEYLEQCGNEQNEGEISEKTPELLTLYRSYREKLSVLFEEEKKEDMREEIAPEQLKQAYDCIREFVDAFDFDSADEVLHMLEDYRIPEQELDRYAIIKRGIVNVDRDEVLRQFDL